MICKHDTHANSLSISLLVHLMQALHLVRRSPWFQYGIISSFPPFHSTPLQLAINTNATNRRPRQLPNLTSCYYVDILTFGLYMAFRRCLLRVQPTPRPNGQRRVYSHISSSTPPLRKMLRVRHSLRPICFCNPKSLLDLHRPVYPYYHVGWHRSSDSLSR